MNFRVVTDVERSLEEGLAPKRLQRPASREELLEPFAVRERALIVAVGEALKLIGLLESSPDVVAAWKTLCAGFETVTGIAWFQASAWW